MIHKYFKKNNTLLVFSGECFDFVEHNVVLGVLEEYKVKVGLNVLVDLSNVDNFCSQSFGLILRLREFAIDYNASLLIRNPSRKTTLSLTVMRIRDLIKVVRCDCSEYTEICDLCSGENAVRDGVDLIKKSIVSSRSSLPWGHIHGENIKGLSGGKEVTSAGVRCPRCGGLGIMQFEHQVDGGQRYLCHNKACSCRTFIVDQKVDWSPSLHADTDVRMGA
ncbi:MAG: hypothetical protein HQL63_10215 [Magnetococcales bacterium]|nr:hypothetical protein [Magnetococcales bacterium]